MPDYLCVLSRFGDRSLLQEETGVGCAIIGDLNVSDKGTEQLAI